LCILHIAYRRYTISTRSLTTNEKQILSAMHHDSRKSVSQIASELSMRHHTVAYCVTQLKDRGVIRPYILTNPHAIGLTDYCIFFNYIGQEKSARKKIIDHCTNSQKVAYFAELSGPYQFSLSLFCRTVFEVTEFFSVLSALLPGSSFDTSFALRLQYTQFLGRWYHPDAEPKLIDRTAIDKEVQIDDIDKKILGFYSQNASMALEKVAEFAGVSESSVRNRLVKLEKNKVICAYAYFVDVNKIAMSTFRIILSANGLDRSFVRKIYDYMSQHPQASAFVHCAGAWDFELNFDLSDRTEIGAIVENFSDTFGSNIRTMHTISEINVYCAHHFPMPA
jgi:DNA-binding Lrp family transcriptional regulator